MKNQKFEFSIVAELMSVFKYREKDNNQSEFKLVMHNNAFLV